MPRLSICPGLLHATQNVNVAAVGQIILNRVLSGNSKELHVTDIAEQTGLSSADVRGALGSLVKAGLIDLELSCGGDIDSLSPGSLCMTAVAKSETNLFTAAGTTVEGEPLVFSAPQYLGGYWFRARLQEGEGGLVLIIDKETSWEPATATVERAVESKEEAWGYVQEFLSDIGEVAFLPGNVDGPFELHHSSREHDGETVFVLDLFRVNEKDGPTQVATFTGSSRADVYQQALKWHAAAGPYESPDAAPKRGRKSKKA